MYVIYDDENKIAIWWSAKCGCTTIKYIYYKIIKNYEHILFEKDCNYDLESLHFVYQNFDFSKLYYKNILIVRNPYLRILSTYKEKYLSKKVDYGYNDLNFEKFIELLYDKYIIYKYNKDSQILDLHHTTPQFSEEYNNLIDYCNLNNIQFKFDKIYKLEEFNIDNQKDFISNFNNCINNIETDVKQNKSNSQDFISYYNERLKKYVYEIYKNDFDILKLYNINYDIII